MYAFRFAFLAFMLSGCPGTDAPGEGEGEGEGEGDVGEACVDDDGCTDPLTCAPETSLCSSDVGGRCTEDAHCLSGLCSEALRVCGINECPVIGEDCGDGTFCTGGTCSRVCEPRREQGATCLFSSDADDECPLEAVCVVGLVCAAFFDEIALGECAAATERAAGEICTLDDQCAAPLVCSAQRRCAEVK